tara:strand:+ start:92 stop:223 length:132 start_codon:yes stop_codon:yes gene_type:complete
MTPTKLLFFKILGPIPQIDLGLGLIGTPTEPKIGKYKDLGCVA